MLTLSLARLLRRLRLPMTIALSTLLMMSPLFAGVASADPGGPTHTIIVRKVTHLSGKPANGGITPTTTTTTDLGGVTAYSIVGLQWRTGVWLVDASGLTESTTSSAIQELETHGALIHSSSPSDCYFGDYLYIVPSTYVYNGDNDNPGWTPFQTTQKTNCITMTSGHYLIYTGVRTDVSGPDASQVL
jgi:hypothetical protein